MNGFPPIVPVPVPRVPVETKVNGPLSPSLQVKVPLHPVVHVNEIALASPAFVAVGRRPLARWA